METILSEHHSSLRTPHPVGSEMGVTRRRPPRISDRVLAKILFIHALALSMAALWTGCA